MVTIHGPTPAGADIKQIDCREDDGEALLILLRIAHLQFGDFLENVSLDDLSNLAILCEEYDCHRLISPWSGTWIKHQWEGSKRMMIRDERWLYIALSFGRQDIFDEVTINFINIFQISSTGEPLKEGESIREPTPENILGWLLQPKLDCNLSLIHNLEHICSLRIEIISSLLQIPYSLLDRFHRSKLTTVCARGSAKCDAFIYGSLALQLAKAGLWPKIEANAYTENVKCLAHTLERIDIEFYPSAAGETSHKTCEVPSFGRQAQTIFTYISKLNLKCHKNHMDMRSRTDYLKNIAVGKEV